MAKQSGAYFLGRRGHVIGYMWKNIACLRTVPVQVLQTSATKGSAKKFGIAQKTAKHIRHALPSILPDPKDRKMMHRLNAAVYQWLLHSKMNSKDHYQPVIELGGFSFSEKKSFAQQV